MEVNGGLRAAEVSHPLACIPRCTGCCSTSVLWTQPQVLNRRLCCRATVAVAPNRLPCTAGAVARRLLPLLLLHLLLLTGLVCACRPAQVLNRAIFPINYPERMYKDILAYPDVTHVGAGCCVVRFKPLLRCVGVNMWRTRWHGSAVRVRFKA